jgi:hypothetical protein
MLTFLRVCVRINSHRGEKSLTAAIAWSSCVLAAGAIGIVLVAAQPVRAQTDNAGTMEKAARSLRFPQDQGNTEGNAAYMLEKHSIVTSAVGVIFGYLDNRAVCWEIADALSLARVAGGPRYSCREVR